MRKDVVRACAFFGALALVFWARVLLGGEALFYDSLLRLFYPNAVFIRKTILSLDFPFWNPHLYSGVPFMANLQSALFYPPTYLYVLFDFPTALSLDVWLHGLLAGAFAYFLGRECALSTRGSLLAGSVFAFNGFIVMHYAFPSNFHSYAWLPLVLLHFRRALAGSLAHAIGAAAALAFQIFAGHPQFVLYACMAMLLLALLEARRLRGVSLALGVAALASALAAVQVIPSLDFIFGSRRAGGLGYDWATIYSLRPQDLLAMLAPLWNRYFTPPSDDPRIVGFYFGLPVLLLALLALVLRPPAHRRDWLPWAGLAVCGLLLSFGRYLHLYPLLYDHVWPFAWLRLPAQALCLACLGTAMLAGQGLDQLLRLGWASKSGARAGAILALCLLDLWVFSLRAVETIDPALYRTEPPSARLLRERIGDSRLLLTPRSRYKTETAGRTKLEAWQRFKDGLYPNLAMAYGLYDADGNEELRSREYEEVLRELAADPLSPWMDRLGVRMVLSFWELPGKFRPAGASSILLFENPGAYPKAYFARHTSVGEGNLEPVRGVEVRTAPQGPNRILLELEAPQAGWVILADSYDPGWRATLNGQKCEVVRVNRMQRGVRVSAGRCVIDYRYRPRYFGAAAFLSLFSLAAALLWLRLSGPRLGRAGRQSASGSGVDLGQGGRI